MQTGEKSLFKKYIIIHILTFSLTIFSVKNEYPTQRSKTVFPFLIFHYCLYLQLNNYVGEEMP